MEHLKVNKHCDCKQSIQWIAENIKTCRIDRNYVERHEPTYNGASISVQLEEGGLWAEFAANEEGWMYVSDWHADNLPEIPLMDGIAEVEKNVDRCVNKMEEESFDHKALRMGIPEDILGTVQ